MSIVVGFIDTPEGNAAVTAAVSEAKLRSTSVVVLHSMVGGGKETGDQYIASSEAIARVEKMLSESGVEYSTHEYIRGKKPAEDIVTASEVHGAELIVIGIRERSSTGKFLLGSNALDILHDAKVPVLCVKPA